MNGVITCSVKEATKLMEHLDEDDMVTLTIIDKKTHIHSEPERIKKKNGEKLIRQAGSIEYQNNEFFGRISLYDVTSEKHIIHNVLFPQLE